MHTDSNVYSWPMYSCGVLAETEGSAKMAVMYNALYSSDAVAD